MSDLYQTLILPSAHQDIFHPLTNLQQLYINIVWPMPEPLPGLLETLENLEVLDLSNTRLMNFDNLAKTIAGLQGNRKLKRLNLWNMKMFEYSDPALRLNLTDILQYLSNAPLEYINVGYNALRQIYPPGIIRFAPNLIEMDASNNMLIPLITSSLFLESLMHPTLKTIHLEQQLYRPMNKKRVKRFDRIGIAGNEKCTLLANTTEMNNLRALFNTNHSAFCAFLYQADLQSFGGIDCKFIPPFHELVRHGCSACSVIPSVGALEQIFLSHLNVYDEVPLHPEYRTDPQCFHPKVKINFLDLSHNVNFGWIGISDLMKTELKGLETLRIFDVSSSAVERLNPYLFYNFPLLEEVYLSNNFLIMTNSSDIFENNPKLRILDLGYNLIETLDDDLFQHLKNLEVLYLKHNRISTFKPNLSNLTHLRILDLSHNRITKLEPSMMMQLDTLAALNQEHSLQIDFTQNDLICTCHGLEFIQWMKEIHHPNITFNQFEHYICQNKDSKWDLMSNIDISGIKLDCKIWIIYIAIGVGSTIITVSIVLIIVAIYRKRWRIKYLIYLAKSWHHKEQTMDVTYQWDAFISYNEYDRFWVHDKLRLKLENEQNLKVCLHYRDFIPGEFIEDQIIDNILKSHKTVLILSPNFLKSKWCWFELQMARNQLFEKGNDILILVILSPLPKRGITKTLTRLLEQKVYLEWTEDPDGQKLFWAKLEDAIRAPRKNDLA